MILKKITLFLLSAVVLMSCGDDEMKSPPFKHVAILNMDNILNPNTIAASKTSYSGRNICHVDSGQGFGIGYILQLPDSLIGKTIGVSINAWVRTGKVDNHCDIICSVTRKDSILLWQGFGADKVIKAPNEWSNLQGTMTIPSNLTEKPNTYINVAAQNADAKSFFDIDDLQITYFEVDKQ